LHYLHYFPTGCCLQAYFYVGPDVDPAVLKELFGVPTWKDMPHPQLPLSLLRTQSSRLNDAVHGVINVARQRNSRYMRLRVITNGRIEEPVFHAQLLEDRIGGVMSYIEFLCHVHKCICDNLQKG
jgi:protein transport protein SEC24